MFASCSGVVPIESRAVTLALAALYRIALDCYAAPAAASLQLRALLAFLFTHSDGCREPFDAFWRQCQEPDNTSDMTGGRRSAYMRGTCTMTQWERIRRSVGMSGDIETMSRIRTLASASESAGPGTAGNKN